MNAPFTQDTRPGRLSTILGKDELVLTGFEGRERLNDLFDFEVSCIAAASDVDFDSLIGTHATVDISTLQGGEQAFDGIVTEARWTGLTDHGDGYQLRLQPWFFLASLRRNQRIFHNKSVIEILEELLGAYADVGKTETRLSQDYPELEYTVQYRESDMDFACRMMERHGISYHFEHKSGDHLMVLSDDAKEHIDIGARPYKPHAGHHMREIGHVRRWARARRITTGTIRLTDYNFKTPTAAMEVDRTGDAGHPQGAIESYDFPGDYLEAGRGSVVADLRTKSERGQSDRFEADGDVVSLRAGSRMTLEGDAVPGHGAEYLCLSATHLFRANAYRSSSEVSDEDAYEGHYVMMPSDRPMVPERKTPLATVRGPQTGTVVGDGEIDCDEYGRILVHLHWDLDKAHTMRCRVSQNWASKGWGGMVIPRIGMEVVVEFLEGDPDKPLVTGCVYNGKNDPPYPLPEHKTKSVFRSDTHQGGGFNEITFEDQCGEENISLHAQKDQTLKVLNNRSKRVDNDQVESVGRNKAISIGKNHQENIGGSMNLSVGSSGFGLFAALGAVAAAGGQDALAGAEAVGDKGVSGFVGAVAQVGAMTESLTGGKASGFAGAGNHKAIAGAEQVATGSSFGALLSSTMPMSGVMNTVVEKFVSDTIGLARTEQIGAYKNTSVGHTMTVNVGTEFVINVGKSKFVMDSDGNVTIIGTKFNFTASGNVQINGKVIDLN